MEVDARNPAIVVVPTTRPPLNWVTDNSLIDPQHFEEYSFLSWYRYVKVAELREKIIKSQCSFSSWSNKGNINENAS
jgi:hypothetical protein